MLGSPAQGEPVAQTQVEPARPAIWTKTEDAVDRFTHSRPIQTLRRWSKLERFLAALCLLIPAALILWDAGLVRDSISDYYRMANNQVFYYPLTVAAMLFLVNGVIKQAHAYNIVLGLLLSGVILFNHIDRTTLHAIFAIGFFVGNAIVILLFSTGTAARNKWLYVLGIAGAMAVWWLTDWFTLFYAEWLSFAIIAVHYILDSRAEEKGGYRAAKKHESRVTT